MHTDYRNKEARESNHFSEFVVKDVLLVVTDILNKSVAVASWLILYFDVHSHEVAFRIWKPGGISNRITDCGAVEANVIVICK